VTETSVSTRPIRAIAEGIVGLVGRLYRWLDRVPYALLAIPLRVAVVTVFWNSGMTKLADWNAALSLFADEYQVPLLRPGLAANLALAIEVTTPVLLVGNPSRGRFVVNRQRRARPIPRSQRSPTAASSRTARSGLRLVQ
jgi:hypothetical protein